MPKRSKQTLKQKIMTAEKMKGMYAELLLVPGDSDNDYGEISETEEKEVWLMHHFDIPKSQATTLRVYLDMEAKKAFAKMDSLYAKKRGSWDIGEELKEANPAFVIVNFDDPAPFLNWYLDVLQTAMEELSLKPAGFDFKNRPAKWRMPEHFYDFINKDGLHSFIFMGAYWMGVAESQWSNKTYRKGRHPVISSFQFGHCIYEKMKMILEEGNNTN